MTCILDHGMVEESIELRGECRIGELHDLEEVSIDLDVMLERNSKNLSASVESLKNNVFPSYCFKMIVTEV